MSRRASDAKALQPLHTALTDALRQAGLGNLVTLVDLQRNWVAIAGSRLAAVSYPVRFRWEELLISVSDAIWLQQMTFYQAQLRQNIRSVVGDVKVSNLRFVLTYAPDQPSRSPSSIGEPTQPALLTADEERRVREGTACIADPELREAAKRAWRQDLLAKR
jgi:predicted nucleic acid-binding Zn ribbon protein